MPGKSFICKVCGYKYNTTAGDARHGIKPGTAFFELGDNWVCPVCKQPKAAFEALPLED